MKNIIVSILSLMLLISNYCYAQPEVIEIKEILYYRDGGTTGVILQESNGKEISLCFSPQSVLFYGATHGSLKGAQKLEIESALEHELLSKIQNSINLKVGAEKKLKLSEVESAMGLSKEDTKLWRLLRALKLYKEKREKIIFKKGKSEIEYKNNEIGYCFIYPTAWEETSNGIQFIGSPDHSMGVIEAEIQINVENSNGLTHEQWYKKEFNKYKKKGYKYNKEMLKYKIANAPAYHFWDIIPQEYSVYDNYKFKMGQVVFLKNNKIYSIFYFNQSLNKDKFKDSLEKVLKSFQIIE